MIEFTNVFHIESDLKIKFPGIRLNSPCLKKNFHELVVIAVVCLGQLIFSQIFVLNNTNYNTNVNTNINTSANSVYESFII